MTGLSDANDERVLCIAAHADDEVLGVAGTLAMHAARGARITVLILSEGESEKLEGTPACDDRKACARRAAEVLGVHELIFGDLPDQRFDARPFIDVIKWIERAIATSRPRVVYTHHHGDANTDHQIAFKATYAACRPMSRLGSSVRRVLCYESPSSTDQAPALPHFAFLPNVYVDVDSWWDTKLAALRCYPSELLEWPHPRSIRYIESLAIKRGGESGLRRAEAFSLLRESICPHPS